MLPAEIFGLSALTIISFFIPFAEDYFRITETFVGARDERELESRVKLRSSTATAEGACECSPLLKLVGLGLFVELQSNFLIACVSHLHVVIKRRGLCRGITSPTFNIIGRTTKSLEESFTVFVSEGS